MRTIPNVRGTYVESGDKKIILIQIFLTACSYLIEVKKLRNLSQKRYTWY